MKTQFVAFDRIDAGHLRFESNRSIKKGKLENENYFTDSADAMPRSLGSRMESMESRKGAGVLTIRGWEREGMYAR